MKYTAQYKYEIMILIYGICCLFFYKHFENLNYIINLYLLICNSSLVTVYNAKSEFLFLF